MPRLHTDRLYEGELRKIREMILMMGAKVEEMLSQAMRALVERDSELAERTLYIDRQINRLEIEVDDLCLRVLARRQPVASDLRFLTMALKVVTDLERMGDLGVNICERVMELNEEPPLKPYVEVVNMAEAAQEMLREALDAFVAGDAERAQAIVERDSNVDAYYATIFRELLTYMMENPRNIFRATRVQSIAKYLERIADHATNLAEMVVFMVRGKDIRHIGKLERRQAASSRPPAVAPRSAANDSDASLRDVVQKHRGDAGHDGGASPRPPASRRST
jgi:phosphate transport system protein